MLLHLKNTSCRENLETKGQQGGGRSSKGEKQWEMISNVNLHTYSVMFFCYHDASG